MSVLSTLNPPSIYLGKIRTQTRLSHQPCGYAPSAWIGAQHVCAKQRSLCTCFRHRSASVFASLLPILMQRYLRLVRLVQSKAIIGLQILIGDHPILMTLSRRCSYINGIQQLCIIEVWPSVSSTRRQRALYIHLAHEVAICDEYFHQLTENNLYKHPMCHYEGCPYLLRQRPCTHYVANADILYVQIIIDLDRSALYHHPMSYYEGFTQLLFTLQQFSFRDPFTRCGHVFLKRISSENVFASEKPMCAPLDKVVETIRTFI